MHNPPQMDQNDYVTRSFVDESMYVKQDNLDQISEIQMHKSLANIGSLYP